MIVVMHKNHTEEDIVRVIGYLNQYGFDVHKSSGVNHVVLGAIGVHPDFDLREIQTMPGVLKVFRITEPFKLSSRNFKKESTVVRVGVNQIGGNNLVVIAGPCAIESEEQIFSVAKSIADSGATILRGGAYKPRTSPYSFQGLGETGLKFLYDAGKSNNLSTVTEVLDIADIDLVARYADILQIGARNMQNFSLLKQIGKAGKPVLLKRGFSATIDEWLMAAEYILNSGNDQVILCERGIRTFENSTRNTLDISAISVVHEKSHLPIIVDPSHAVGSRDKVSGLALASVVAGADGVMVEVHPEPEKAKSDGVQSLYPKQFSELMKNIIKAATVINRGVELLDKQKNLTRII